MSIKPLQVDASSLTGESSSSVANLINRQGAPEDVFASMHYMYAPLALKLLNRLSKKQLIRVVAATIEIPPNEKQINSFEKLQKDLFYMLEKVYLSKYSMFLQAAVERAEREAQGGSSDDVQKPSEDGSQLVGINTGQSDNVSSK